MTHKAFHRLRAWSGWVTGVGRSGLVDPLLRSHVVRHSMRGKWPEPNHSVSSRVSNSSSSRKIMPRFQVGCSQPSPLQEQAQQGRAARTGEDISKESPIRVCWANPQEGDKHFFLVPDNSLRGRHTLNDPDLSSTPLPLQN